MMIDIYYTELYLLIFSSLFSDLRFQKVKNSVLIISAAFGLLTNIVFGGISALFSSLLGCIIPIFLLFVLFMLRMLGAGDIKLFACIGAIMGYAFALPVIAYAFLAGGILALVIMLYRGNLKQRFRYLFNYLKLCYLTQEIRPYADKFGNSCCFRFSYAIAVGCVIQIIVSK